MGYVPNYKQGTVAPPTPFATATAATNLTPGFQLAALPEEAAISTMLGNKAQPSGTAPAISPTAATAPVKKGGGGAFPGFTPNTTNPSLQAPMTGEKTLTGQ